MINNIEIIGNRALFNFLFFHPLKITLKTGQHNKVHYTCHNLRGGMVKRHQQFFL